MKLCSADEFTPIVNTVLSRSFSNARTLTDKIDFVITHKFFGPLIFFALMLFIFQAIFAWSVIPMDWIDQQFANLATYLQSVLPDTILSRLLTEGLIPGISGVMVFVRKSLFYFC